MTRLALTLALVAMGGCGHWVSPLFDTRDWGWWERKRIEREQRQEKEMNQTMTRDYFSNLARLLRVPFLQPWQGSAIAASAEGRDVLAICPTGSGKSVAFWGAGIAACSETANELSCDVGGTAGGMGCGGAVGGVVLVVSPLRSLIADQHRRLTANGARVRIWNSDVSIDRYFAEM